MPITKIIGLCIAIALLAFPAYAATSLQLPRFVTIVSGEANLRNGPGLVYEKKWLYVRRNIPVKVIAEMSCCTR